MISWSANVCDFIVLIIAAQRHCICRCAPFQFDSDGITILQRRRCVARSARAEGQSMSTFKIGLLWAMADEWLESVTANWGRLPGGIGGGKLKSHILRL